MIEQLGLEEVGPIGTVVALLMTLFAFGTLFYMIFFIFIKIPLAAFAPDFLWTCEDWWEYWIEWKIFRYDRYKNGEHKITDSIRKEIRKLKWEYRVVVTKNICILIKEIFKYIITFSFLPKIKIVDK